MKIAVNGPAGAGKGTIARALAVEEGIEYVDLGIIFRFGAFGLGSGKVSNLGQLIGSIEKGDLLYRWSKDSPQIIWQDQDVTSFLLTQDAAYQTSVLASDPVQQEMLTLLANSVLKLSHDVVCDGRNAGTTILPDADYKFFITACLKERARRRHLDIVAKGRDSVYEDVLKDIEARDRRDAERLINPFVVPSGAVVLETDLRTVQESVRFIQNIIRPKA